MKPLAIALLNVRRLFRDRSNIFFVIITPFVMIFLMGLLFGGGRQLHVGVAGGTTPLADRLATSLGSPSIQVARFGSEERLLADVERGRLHGGLVIPAGYEATLRAGGRAEVRYVSRPGDPAAADLGSRVRWAVSREAAVLKAAQFGAAEGGTAGRADAGADAGAASAFDESLRLASGNAGVDVKVVTVGRSEIPPGFGQFAFSAPPLLLLYTFLTALTASIGLVQTRRLGISRRMYASPTPARTIVAGEAAGRLAIALLQSLLIMLGSAVLFGVDWGDPLGAAAMVILFALVGGGAATLLGALVGNEGVAISVSVILGLGLGALGGTMVPLDSFEGTLRTIAHLTPHAWGYDGFAELVRHDADLPGISSQLGVLAGYAAVLFALGSWCLRRALVR
ncbi:ABC transporter permease [Nonomuraea cavernae]|uniref:Transport permease YfiM n=1 Tax=Nonomuraea cavernae TaxID=2045107 RepID=A0A917YVB8_9ACTN|nr:ABC transporter permease [Nonomuraea cavernae]MCA2186759.1 ABC transporter permease [Nonomuraea cavernae]GGO67681.1 putative transport permease YfiM [Nonomuraea cavernae]